MKKLLQDRKTLYLVLSIVMISVFTLSIAYAAMSAVLEIHGNSEVVASTWDIHLDNVEVKSGSVSANAPQISGTSSLSFDVELNTPGDYYEFTVDVVNGGSIDAMIDSVVKTPNLTEVQSKYIKYEVTYENGESISSNQTIKSGTSTPIKVRVEYRKDLVASDLPSSATELSLKLTLVYVQSDGTGSSIPNNGAESSLVNVVSGDGTQVGDEICIDTECFYVISSTDSAVTMLAKYDLHVGYYVDEFGSVWEIENPTGMQQTNLNDSVGTAFSSETQKGINNSSFNGSIVEIYVNNYMQILYSFGVVLENIRLIKYDEVINLGCERYFDEEAYDYVSTCQDAPAWIYNLTYWMETPSGDSEVWIVQNGSNNIISFEAFSGYDGIGVRPVITISKDYL